MLQENRIKETVIYIETAMKQIPIKKIRQVKNDEEKTKTKEKCKWVMKDDEKEKSTEDGLMEYLWVEERKMCSEEANQRFFAASYGSKGAWNGGRH